MVEPRSAILQGTLDLMALKTLEQMGPLMEHNHGSIGWKRWLMIAVPPTILAMILMSFLLIYKSQIGWY